MNLLYQDRFGLAALVKDLLKGGYYEKKPENH